MAIIYELPVETEDQKRERFLKKIRSALAFAIEQYPDQPPVAPTYIYARLD